LQTDLERRLAGDFPFVSSGAGTSWRTPAAIAELTHIKFEFANGTAQSIAVHPQLPGGATLIALVLFEDGCYETFLEFSYCFGIKDVASIHLVYKCFELIFHRNSLSVCSNGQTAKA
jgi:hypothetical protein